MVSLKLCQTTYCVTNAAFAPAVERRGAEQGEEDAGGAGREEIPHQRASVEGTREGLGGRSVP